MTPCVEIRGPTGDAARTLLTSPALEFVASLVNAFDDRLDLLLSRRRQRQEAFDQGARPHFLDETKAIRESDWTVAKLPPDLLDRRVEITGPVDRKMIINALNSGASVFMADFEDSNSPTWSNVVEGQLNLYEAIRRTIAFTTPEKSYRLNDHTALLMVRPRGLHLREHHAQFKGRPIPASLFDFGLFAFHNARAQLERGSGPYFYLPKLESHLEARWWNDVFFKTEEALGLPSGSIKATVLIETIPAVFEMNEILFELKEHSAGLNCGRWDYIFSFIKTFRNHEAFLLPDRGDVGMTQPFMSAYSQLLVRTCHHRNVHAMGGMAAQIPIKNDEAANEAALAKVRADKLREVKNGHDGTWVAHPALVPIAKAIFDEHMPTKNQLDRKRDDVSFSAEDLLAVPTGRRTEAGLRQNIRVGIEYLEAWLRGSGCVPLHNLMEDAATAEISRAQIWQWIRHSARLDDERVVTRDLVKTLLTEEMAAIRSELGEERMTSGCWAKAQNLFIDLATREVCADFLTIPAYDLLVAAESTQPEEKEHARAQTDA
ncbi:MAG: malate synthase A [Deltaproteobacteria bacterium]|nr:malate synthase A [Deltaproteobacteria bacterium]